MHQQSKGFAVSTSLIRGFLTLGALVFSFSGGAYAAAPPTYNSWCTHYDCGPSGAQVEGIKDMMRRRGISINANDAPRANTLTANAVCSLIGYKAGTTNSVGHFPAAPACANYYIVGFNGTNWYKTGSCLDNNYIAALTCSQPVQCQDGIDNDGDGLLDENDPGCSSCLDDSEGPGTSQCQDGLDNDGDGAADYPADASCSSPQDNDETNPKTQCQDGIDNEPDGLIDMEDPGCSSPQDNNEGDEQCVPQAPTGLNAGDGSSADYVGIAWSAAARADTYQVFRISSCAQQNGGQMEAVSPAISGTSFQDASAIPGVVYSYAVKATGYCGTSALSNADNGYRSNGDDGIDNDGDGVSDEQEQADGTDACDAGSFQLHLKSPAFTKYNTFLRQWNFLELIASGTKAIQAKVSVYLLSGVVLATQDVYIEPQKQVDVNIHEMIRTACVQSSYCSGLRDIDNNGIVDTYGLVRIDFNDDEAGAVLTGRMSNYRQDSNGTFSFAFAKELRNPTRGATAATSNTYDPQAMGYLVPNWLEIINLDSVERTFAYNLYNQEGVRVLTKSVSIPPLGERDIQAGHEIVNAQNKVVESVYLAEIIPQNGAAKYFATVSRYSSNAKAGVEPATYNFAFALDGRSGNGDTQYMPISNAVGVKFLQTNWVEVVNTLNKTVTATLYFRGADGSLLANPVTQAIKAKAQYHFNASALLPKNGTGTVELRASDKGALIAQSLVYYHDSSANKVQTAYASQGRIAGQNVQSGSINTFLGMTDTVKLLSAVQSPVSVTAELRTFDAGSPVKTTTIQLNAMATGSVSTALGSALSTQADRYGALTLRSAQPGVFAAEVLRERIGADGIVDFAFPTAIQ